MTPNKTIPYGFLYRRGRPGGCIFSNQQQQPPRKKRSKERETNKKQKNQARHLHLRVQGLGLLFPVREAEKRNTTHAHHLDMLVRDLGLLLVCYYFVLVKAQTQTICLFCFSLKQAHHLHLLVRDLGLDRTTIEVLKQKRLAWVHSLSVIGFILYQIMLQL